MCYAPVVHLQCKLQWYSYSAISSVCYGVSDMSHGHNSTVFLVLFPKISTGQKKLAPTGRHGRHVFATLSSRQVRASNIILIWTMTNCH